MQHDYRNTGAVVIALRLAQVGPWGSMTRKAMVCYGARLNINDEWLGTRCEVYVIARNRLKLTMEYQLRLVYHRAVNGR